MKKSILIAIVCSVSFFSNAQVENHLNNNNGNKETFFRATNKFSLNTPNLIGGLTMGVLKGNQATGNPGF